MPGQRTELRDELTALIAAGRELPPDHDQILAEVFIDRLTTRAVQPSRTRQALAVIGKPRHLLGALILGLTLLGAAAVQPFHQAGSTSVFVQSQPAMVKCVGTKQHPACVHVFQGVPVGPGKVPVVPVAPKAPLAPKAPVAPQAPASKSGS